VKLDPGATPIYRANLVYVCEHLRFDSNLLIKRHLDAKPNAKNIVPKLLGGWEAGIWHVFFATYAPLSTGPSVQPDSFLPGCPIPCCRAALYPFPSLFDGGGIETIYYS
jgi:hypothetical protein